MMYRLRAALQGFCRRLSRFMTRHFIDRKSEWADVEELGENVGQDARFLRLQLTKARAENTDLKSQTKDFGSGLRRCSICRTMGCGKLSAATKSGGNRLGHPVKWFWSIASFAVTR